MHGKELHSKISYLVGMAIACSNMYLQSLFIRRWPLQIDFNYKELPDYSRSVIEKEIQIYREYKPENPRYTIRFLKAPSPGWAAGEAPLDDNTEKVG